MPVRVTLYRYFGSELSRVSVVVDVSPQCHLRLLAHALRVESPVVSERFHIAYTPVTRLLLSSTTSILVFAIAWKEHS